MTLNFSEPLRSHHSILGRGLLGVPIAAIFALLLSCSPDQVGYDVQFEVIPETKTQGPGCVRGRLSERIPLPPVTESEGIFGLLDCGMLNFRGEGDTSAPVEITGRADIQDACGERFSWAEFKGNVPAGRYVITSEGVATDTRVLPVSFFQNDSERFFNYLMSDGTACETGGPFVGARAEMDWSVCGETPWDGNIRLVVEGTCTLAPPGGTAGTGGSGGTGGSTGTDIGCDEGLCLTDPDVRMECVEGVTLCIAEREFPPDGCIRLGLAFCRAGGTDIGCDEGRCLTEPDVRTACEEGVISCIAEGEFPLDFCIQRGLEFCRAGGTAVCGDGVAEFPEECDGGDVQGLDCTYFGFTGGTLGCTANCVFDTSACTGGPVCGDGVAEFPEVCDGTDLGYYWTGLTCADAGFTGGTLACNATCDNVDLTACTGGPLGWTCAVFYYNDAVCDCGCGVLDPDCIDGTVASCDYCGAEGSCNPFDVDCLGNIVPAQNWLCLSQL